MAPMVEPGEGRRARRRVDGWPGAPAARLLPWLALALVGWGGLAVLAGRMVATFPPTAGFDLELLLGAGRRVAAGLSPYAASMLGGRPPSAEDLFYSYPPPVAQAMSPIAGISLAAALLGLAVVSVGGLGIVTGLAARRIEPDRPAASAVLPVVAVAPFVFPFAVALLFGNLDATFPLLYGLIALGALSGGRGSTIAGGAALAIAAVKLYPASLGIWFVARGFRERDGSGRLVGVAVAIWLAIAAASILAGGPGPWRDYLDAVRSGASAELVDPRNIGPAAQLAALLSGGENLARAVQVGVSIGAVILIAAAALWLRDPLQSVTLAATASLVMLPVTWFHYPAALLPFAVMAWLRVRADGRPGSVGLPLAAAAIVSAGSIVFPVGLWVAVAAVLLAVHRSRARDRDPRAQPGPTPSP